MELKENNCLNPIIYAFLYAGVWGLSRIPYHTGQRIGRALGSRIGKLLGGRIAVSLDNLRYIYGNTMTESQLRDLNTRVTMHFAQTLFEAPHILRLNPTNLERYVVFENGEYFLTALGEGKGALILTGHFGNWELMSAAVSLRFVVRGAVIARPVNFLPADRLVNHLRSRFGNAIIPKQRAMRKVLKAIKENTAVGFLMDQNVDWYEGVFVRFLGRLACTNKGLALLALRTGAPVIPMFSVRQPDGRYRIIFERAVELIRTGDKTRDIEENTQLFSSIIERYVQKYPDQWFWFHRRWKTRPYCRLQPGY